MKFSILCESPGRVEQYAARELAHFLEKYTNALPSAADADRWYTLRLTASLPAHGWRFFRRENEVLVEGGSPSALLCGVYDLLGAMGVCFRADGDSLEGALRFDVPDTERVPRCRLRGVRQHVNFPMDISSYPLWEAQEYIRCLARMRMNAITFHSYTGQWHGCGGHEPSLPGNFFYGQRHPLPDYAPVSSKVRNETEYCIPEAEAIVSDPQQRGEFAVRWMRALMETAKEAGLQVTVSVELPDDTPDVQLAMARGVLESYPAIDVLEWITPEGGGETKVMTWDEAQSFTASLFPGCVLDRAALPDAPQPPIALYGTLLNLKKAAALYERRDEVFAGLPEKPVQIGLYVTCRDTLKLVKRVMDAVLPKNICYTFLPAHGSMAVADNIAYMEFLPEDYQRTMLYSWVEFDGNMYLQQNSCDGIRELERAALEKSGGEPIHGICLNHWRTAENDAVLWCAAQTLVEPMEPDEGYRRYADSLGIGGRDTFADAMRSLAGLDVFNRDRLFNIGFCYLGCWLNPKGLGWIRGWKEEDIDTSSRTYGEIREKLAACLGATSSREGIRVLRLLMNRMECSMRHLRAIRALHEICAFADDEAPAALTEEQKERVAACCDRAREAALSYLDLHMEQIPDRGCEGTAVSYAATILTYIDHIRAYFVEGETECCHRPPSFDQPPPPDTAYLNA